MAQNEQCPKCGWEWAPTEKCVYYVCPKCHAVHAEGSSTVEDLGPRDDYAPRSDKERPAVPFRGFCAKNCEFSGHSKLITSIKFNYDGNCLASLGYDDTIRLWSLGEKKELECFNYKYKGNYKAIGFSPDNKLYAAGISQPNRDDPYRLVVADVNTKKALASLKLGSKGYPFSSNAPESIVFNPQCNLVAAIYSCIEVIRPYKGGDIFICQLSKKLFGYKLKEVANMCGRVSHYRFPLLAFNPDGDILVTTQPVMVEGSVSGNRWVAIAEFWNVQSGKLVDMIEIPDLLGIKSIHFTLDGNVLLGTELGGLRSFRLWDKKRNRVTTIEHSAEVLSSAISPNGRLLATGDKAGLVRLTSIPEGNEISRIQAGSQNYGVSCVAFSPDGNSIALTADKIEVWGLS